MEIEQETSLEDDIRASFDEVAEVEPTPLSEETATRARDEAGKFIASKVEPEATPEIKPEEGPITLTTEKPPSTWTPAARELWKDLPDAAKSEIIRREQDAANLNHRMQEQYAPLDHAFNELGTLFQEANQYGIDGAAYIRSTMETERVLRNGEMPDKFNALLSVADTYGIPLREIINQSIGKEVLQKPTSALPPDIMNEINEIRQWRSEQEYRTVVNEVEGWGANREFFNDVRSIMADLVERQMVSNIDQAYDTACRMHPDVFNVLVQRSAQPAGQNSVVARQKQATGVSKTTAGRSAPTATSDKPTTIEEDVREAFYASSGRV